MCFKVHTVLMKSEHVLLHPAQGVNYPFAHVSVLQMLSQLVASLVTRSLLKYCGSCVQVTLILLNNHPKVQE